MLSFPQTNDSNPHSVDLRNASTSAFNELVKHIKRIRAEIEGNEDPPTHRQSASPIRTQRRFANPLRSHVRRSSAYEPRNTLSQAKDAKNVRAKVGESKLKQNILNRGSTPSRHPLGRISAATAATRNQAHTLASPSPTRSSPFRKREAASPTEFYSKPTLKQAKKSPGFASPPFHHSSPAALAHGWNSARKHRTSPAGGQPLPSPSSWNRVLKELPNRTPKSGSRRSNNSTPVSGGSSSRRMDRKADDGAVINLLSDDDDHTNVSTQIQSSDEGVRGLKNIGNSCCELSPSCRHDEPNPYGFHYLQI